MKNFLTLVTITFLSACLQTRWETEYKIIKNKETGKNECIETIKKVQIIKPETKTKITQDGSCSISPPISIGNQDEKTEILCTKTPRIVSLSKCGIGEPEEIRGWKFVDNVAVCYSKTYNIELPISYCSNTTIIMQNRTLR